MSFFHLSNQIKFSDIRESEVFLSYQRAFSLFVFDSSIKRVLELGAGQSTIIWGYLANRLGWEIHCIDMNPAAMKTKIRDSNIPENILDRVQFYTGVTLPATYIKSYYQTYHPTIAGVPLTELVAHASQYINTSHDSRKVQNVIDTLSLSHFSPQVISSIIPDHNLSLWKLIDIYRTPFDELSERYKELQPEPLLKKLIRKNKYDIIFLDSGEFSSLPEFDLLSKYILPGTYLVLHDILFPKSFKNWLVAAAISSSPDFEILHQDFSLPQGLLIAIKK